MAYAYVVNGEILAYDILLPHRGRRLDNRQVVLDLHSSSIETQKACGFYLIVTTTPPEPLVTQRLIRLVVMINGEPTEQWLLREETEEELDIRVEQENETRLLQRAIAALVRNNEFANTPNSEITNLMAIMMIKDHCRQLNAMIKLRVRNFSTEDET